MMQIMPILVADESALKDGPEGELRALQVKAFRLYAVFYKAHLLDNVKERGMPHHYSTEMWERTHKGTVKGPVRGSSWSDIPRQILEEEVQREVYRKVAADAGGGRQYACALREAILTKKPVLTKKYRTMRIGGASDPVYDEYITALGDDMKGLADEFKALGLATNSVQVHTAVAIPRTRGGELVAKGTFVKASPRERWYSDVALLNDKGGDWYAKCLCIFRAVDRDGDWKGYAYVRYYKKAGSCNLTGCMQLHKTVEDVRFSVVELKSLQSGARVPFALLATAHPDDVFCFHEINFLPSRLPKSYIPDKRNVVERIVSVGILYNATGGCSAVPVVVLEPSNRPERRRASAALRKVAVRYTNRGRLTPEGFRATPAASASDDSSGDMSLPDGPLLRDERSRRRVIRNVTNAYVERADELGIPPAAVPAEVGASNQEVISRLCRTPVKRARVGERAENGTAEEVLQSDEVLESDDDQ
ncbi:unnamed protein product [Closterium sp. NIES-64]|nr:unnamed protein product [Closterium sp. NIES-64]